MKKILALALIVVFTLSLLIACGGSGELTYRETEHGIIITGHTGNQRNIVIPSQIDGKNVFGIGGEAFKDNTMITSVSIPRSVYSIMGGAFYGCTSLADVIFPDGVNSGLTIAENAFNNTPSLSEDSMQTIGARIIGFGDVGD